MPTTAYPATLSIGGQVIGAAQNVTIDPEASPYVDRPFPFTHSFTNSIKLRRSERRQLAELVTPGLKDFHHWARVQRAQESRRIARRKQGR